MRIHSMELVRFLSGAYVAQYIHDLPTCKLFKDVPKGIIFDKIHTYKPAKASLAYQ